MFWESESAFKEEFTSTWFNSRLLSFWIGDCKTESLTQLNVELSSLALTVESNKNKNKKENRIVFLIISP